MAKVTKKAVAAAPTKSGEPAKREYVKQSDIPSMPLEEALRVPRALAEQYGKRPATPIEVAAAIGLQPNTGTFRAITGAAVAYGVTEGGAYADMIGLSEIGRRIVAPMTDGDDVSAMREAVMKPRVVREFLEKYDGSPVPSLQIGCNVLETMGVPSARAEQTFHLIVESADTLGLITTINTKMHVNLRAAHLRAVPDQDEIAEEHTDDVDMAASQLATEEPKGDPAKVTPTLPEKTQNRRVFVSHGSNKTIVTQLKDMLTFGEYEPVISVERETTSKPVPDKVMDDMRSCSKGIIHVGKEKTIVDADGAEHVMLNENVLIEIGAAMALYVRDFILLVEEGAKLPSNLQGLYEVRYEGTTLDATATMRLLRAFNEFKS
jgi:predicted nucleotide-binding protein